jgi:hypothetical protein
MVAETFPPFALVHLSDTQWREIQNASGIPEGARGRIECELNIYNHLRELSASRLRSATRRKELSRIAELADDLLTAIIGHNADARLVLNSLAQSQSGAAPVPIEMVDRITARLSASVRLALIGPLPQPSDPDDDARAFVEVVAAFDSTAERQRLFELCLAIERLRFWFDELARSLPTEKKGAHQRAQQNEKLVSRLDAVLSAHTGKHISLAKSYRRYVAVCFKAADPAIVKARSRKP